MTDRIPGAPGRCKAVVTGEELQKLQSGEEFAITLRRDDAPIKEGTPYNKASVLPDDLAKQLCPELADPTPGDAFSALQSGKADAGRRKTGSNITLTDAADAPLQGLKIYGRDTPEGTVGENGSVTVKLMGKNIADLRKISAKDIKTASTTAVLSNNYGTTLSATTGDSITVTQSKWPNTTIIYSYTNGFVVFGFYCPLRTGDRVTISFDYEITNNPLNITGSEIMVKINNSYQTYAQMKNNKVYYSQLIDANAVSAADGWNYFELRNCGTSGVISNFQVEYGATATDYVPYKEPQTITVPTPGGLPGGHDVWDEIDFAKGVLIRRIAEQTETPLPEDVLAAYTDLRSYADTTKITNDADAQMEVCYCTPTTAVPMIHSAAACGKFLAIDSAGAVSPHTVAVYVEHTERTDGWDSRIWSDGFTELHKKDTEEGVIGQNGTYQVTYDLPFPVDSDCTVQVTPLGNVHLTACEIADMSLCLTFAGQAGTPISAIHISLAGRVKSGV